MGPDLNVTRHHVGEGHVQRHVVGGNLPLLANELPIEFRGVVPLLGRAEHAILQHERGVGITRGVIDADLDAGAVVVHVVHACRTRIHGPGISGLRVSSRRAIHSKHLERLGALRLDVPEDERVGAVEAESASLGDGHGAVR